MPEEDSDARSQGSGKGRTSVSPEVSRKVGSLVKEISDASPSPFRLQNQHQVRRLAM